MRASITLVVRILSLAAILLAGAAVASASQQPPDVARVAHRVVAADRSPETLAATQFAAYPLDQTLIARADPFGDDPTAPYLVAAPINEPAATSRTEADGYGLPLPAPDRTTAILATCAVVGFFFLRRLL